VAKADPAVAKLKRIRKLVRQLWIELERETSEGEQYEAIAKQISVLSAEFQALAKTLKKLEKLE
jgi:hypothetical protein